MPYTPSEKEGTRDTPAGDYAKKVIEAFPRYDKDTKYTVYSIQHTAPFGLNMSLELTELFI